MAILLVLDNPKDWPLNIDGVDVVSARKYLTDAQFSTMKLAKVFNLCKSYRYQSLGYYVSLLAAARGHKPLPDISTIQDLKLSELIRFAGEELEELVQTTLSKEKEPTFVLSIYFGRNVDKKYDRLALALFNQFPAPFLRAEFKRDEEGRWSLESLRPIAASEIPQDHFLFVLTCATHYFTKPHRKPRQQEARYDLAILYNKAEKNPPSNEKALKKFTKAAESMGFEVEMITRDDYGRIPEFDALFIRDTTAVNHFTFRFARRAAAEGLVVVDDPDAIVKCSNKVYLAELLHHHRIATPPTLILHKGNWESAPSILGLPLVLKQPDSSFSLGVVKVETAAEYTAEIERLFKISDLLIAQAFMPTPYDWRVGIFDREPVYCCKYFMAGQHWQIYDNTKTGDDSLGEFETWPVSACPPDVIKAAIRVGNLIGDGLYGVDLKEIDGKAYIIEINDNPNIDAGIEDKVLGEELYLRIMRVFLRRLESRGR
ncbi:MAG: RimK family protein [Planctomycetota bacterium]|nr:RimK family protein [Planctomycetota bacterium]